MVLKHLYILAPPICTGKYKEGKSYPVSQGNRSRGRSQPSVLDFLLINHLFIHPIHLSIHLSYPFILSVIHSFLSFISRVCASLGNEKEIELLK